MRLSEFVRVSHNTWWVVGLDIDCASSRSSPAPACQILARRNSVPSHHMTQSDILIVEHHLVETLRLTTRSLGLAIVIEVIVEQRWGFVTVFREELLDLLVFTH